MSTAPDGRPTWAEVDVAAFRRNVDAVSRMLPERSRLVAVLKANAYGHGAVELARACHPDRVAMIATALLEESLALRRAGITLPLLVLGPLDERAIAVAMENGIVAGVVGPEELQSAAAVARDRDVTIHLELDSGMGRMGLVEADLVRAAEIIKSSPRLRVLASYTHLANANDPHDPHTRTQLDTFARMNAILRDLGIDAPLHHSANSAATMRGIVAPGDYVRCGIALFGAAPLDNGGDRLEPLLRWRTEIARLKTLPPGEGIGYGATFRTSRTSRIATLPVGYADGYDRLLSSRADVLVHGQRAPVVGRVSMDLITIDVTGVPGASPGDEVVLLGRQGDAEISAEEHADKTSTIAYEVFCRISARVPRVIKP